MEILNIIDLRKAESKKIVQFQDKFELEVPIWTNYVTLDSFELALYCWENEPYYDSDVYVTDDDSEFKILPYSIIIDGEFEPICEKVKRIYNIRKDVLNMDIDMWKKFGLNGSYVGTAEYFLNAIGLPGALSAKCNEEETDFFDEIYKIHRNNYEQCDSN